MTPLLEYYDVFTHAENTLDHGDIYKLIDGGNILVLRPDSTTPIGRLVATKLFDSPLPLRLCYSQDVMRLGNGHGGSRTQIRQSGIEFIGADGIRADVEIAETAIAALNAAGLSDFKLELGRAGIFRALAAEIDFSEEDAEHVRKLIEVKNYSALIDVLAGYAERHPEGCEALNRLPRLFGGREVFSEAADVIGNKAASEQIDYLKLVYETLAKLGFEEKITLDLGLVNHMEYYTGIILGGYAQGSGERVLSGGRYGALYRKYGMNVSATGFAVNLDAVCDAVEKNFGQESVSAPDAMVYFANGNEKKAYELVSGLRKKGVCAELSSAESREEAEKCARAKGVKKLIVCDDAVRRGRSCVLNHGS